MAVHRVNVNFSEEAWAALKSLAERRQKTMSEVLRDALAAEMWFQEAKENGDRVLLERGRNGKVREVVLR